MYGVNVNDLQFAMVNAMKKLVSQNVALQARVAALDAAKS
jgi:hypothetical protein